MTSSKPIPRIDPCTSRRSASFWSARVRVHYRALAVEAESDLVWFWIGSHAEYDKLVGRTPASRRMQPMRAKKSAGRRKGRARD